MREATCISFSYQVSLSTETLIGQAVRHSTTGSSHQCFNERKGKSCTFSPAFLNQILDPLDTVARVTAVIEVVVDVDIALRVVSRW